MKVAVSSSGKTLDSQVDSRFGRCPYFIIAGVEDGQIKDWKAVKNTATAYQRGAGPSAVELVANQGAEVIVTQNIGPRAVSAVNELGIKVHKASGVIKEVIKGL